MSRLRLVFGLFLVVGAALALQVGAAAAAPAPGDLDPGFGQRGLGGTGSFASDESAAFAAGPDGEFFVLEPQLTSCPTFVCDGALQVARFDENGSRDPSFSDRARLAVKQHIYQVSDIAVGADGKPVVAAVDDRQAILVRFGRDGTPDATFGGSGSGVTVPLPEAVGTTPQVAVMADGKILLAYEASSVFVEKPGGVFDLEGRFVLARYLADGSLDQSFGKGGLVTVQSAQSVPEAIALRSNGGFVIGFSHCCGTENSEGIGLGVFSADGSFDPSFLGGAGVAFMPRPERSHVGTVALAPAGRIYVTAEQEGRSSILIRLLPSGQPDPTFGANGEVRLGLRTGFSQETEQLATDGAGRVLGIGGRGAGAYVFRLQADGRKDRTFGAGMAVKLPAPGAFVASTGFSLRPGGRIVAIEEFGSYGARSYQLVALKGGSNKVRCQGKRATIVGTAQPETIEGTRGRDVIAALGGADRVRGLGGNDVICGGKGRDSLFGGAGRDKVRQ